MSPHLLRLVFFQRTGVRLLFGDSNFRQNIEDGLAFDFQFPGQVVDSNLTHPPLLCPATFPQVFIAASRDQRCTPPHRNRDKCGKP
jgi:urocanate hydratase